MRKVFSRTWMLREEGIGEIEQQIMDGKIDGNTGFVAGIGVCKETISDKISGVCLRSTKFLVNLCDNLRP